MKKPRKPYTDETEEGIYQEGYNKALENIRQMIENLIEPLSELEHKQWIHWSKSIKEQVVDGRYNEENVGFKLLEKVGKWRPNWIPYNKLDEKTKAFDRIWASKVIEIILEQLLEE